ncbi:MAG: FAD-binding protein [Limnobacter sp.]|nr:FAD-binding protein [Limnobacter sp.]
MGQVDGCHRFRVQAGENWHTFVRWTIKNGYPGLENLALIPGSVGASPVQNIGAYGVELKDRVCAVHGVDLQTGAARVFTAQECGFAYRESVFKHSLEGRFLITALDFCLARAVAAGVALWRGGFHRRAVGGH